MRAFIHDYFSDIWVKASPLDTHSKSDMWAMFKEFQWWFWVYLRSRMYRHLYTYCVRVFIRLLWPVIFDLAPSIYSLFFYMVCSTRGKWYRVSVAAVTLSNSSGPVCLYNLINISFAKNSPLRMVIWWSCNQNPWTYYPSVKESNREPYLLNPKVKPIAELGYLSPSS